MAPSGPRLLLHRQFEEQALKSPDAVALHEANRTITFSDLDARSSRIASALQARGVRDGSMVGLHLERSINWVVGMLGILKTNAAVVPLPPSFPAERLQDILAHAALELIIDSAETQLEPSSIAAAIDIADLLVEATVSNRTPVGRLQQPAFVLCSSGSTGSPKMIVRNHGSFLHRLSWTWEQHPFELTEVCCQKAQATTTHSIYELFEPLLRGIPVVIIPEDDVRNLEAFWDTIRMRGISRLLIVPSTLHASMEMPGFEAPPIKVMVIMGEYVHPALAERALTAFPDTCIYSIYGSTEASSTLVCDLRESLQPGKELPLGHAISADVQAQVLGSDLKPVPPGEVGRLYLSGTALFDEYFRNPDLTDAVFVHVEGQPSPLYDTCDQVRLLPDGNLQFIGRTDQTVKVRGFRVDLQEVENVLLRHQDVSRAAVVVGDSGIGGATLLAFVTPSDIDRSSIYEILKSQLPNYMIPPTLVCVNEFPFTANGKLDRIGLLAKYAAHTPELLPTRELSETERRVSEIWSQILEHHDFAPESSFFEVGGTSLTVFALVHRLRQNFTKEGKQLSAQSVYRFPTLEGIAECIDNIRIGDPPPEKGSAPLLVTLSKGDDPTLAPFFVVASAGGTLGAYEKLARALTTSRDVIGVRDPFIWGERDPTEGFQRWVGRYLEAIRSRQPHGPYFLGAYSSAGAFGFEVARHLSHDGEDVELLALIDPLALDRRNKWRYGWWALRATYARPIVRVLVRLAGWLRIPLLRGLGALGQAEASNDYAISVEDYLQMTENSVQSKSELMALAALLELNTGMPFALTEADFSETPPDRFIGVLQARFERLMPEVDLASIERIVVQYPLQVRTQHAYTLQRYDGQTFLFEPASRYAGLLEALLRPYLRRLRVRSFALGEPSQQTQAVTARFGELDAHYRCMRDDVFVNKLARELDSLLL